MQQAWLEVVGLAFDLFGVLLIAWEWLAAQRQDAAQRAIEAQRERTEAGFAMMARVRQTPDPALERYDEMASDHRRRAAAQRIEATRSRYTGMRTTAVVIGLVFVIVGFLLQLLGAWPGCCEVIGIVPTP